MQLCARAVTPLFGFVVVIASTWIYRWRRDWRSLLFLIAMVVAAWCLLISAIVAGVVPLVTITS